MKYLISILFYLVITSFTFAQNTSISSSPVGKEEGRCTGSSYCSACSTCNYCKYCNGGGSCGVCSSSGSSSTTSSSHTTGNSTLLRKSNSYYLTNDPSSAYYLKTLLVTANNLNLRNGPGSNYSVLRSLSINQELVFLAMTGKWVKVKMKEEDVTGFIHSDFVVVLEN